MVLSFSKLAPTGVVLAFAGFCVWPSVSELTSNPQAKASKKMPPLAASLFSPTLAPAPTRNPFLPKPGEELAATQTTNSANSTGPRLRAAAVKSLGPPLDPRRGLRLDATCLHGNHWQVVINGQLFTSLDAPPTEDNSALDLKIIQVFPHKVTLEREGQIVDLMYSDLLSPPNATSSSAAASAPEISPSAATAKNVATLNPSNKSSVAQSKVTATPSSTDSLP